MKTNKEDWQKYSDSKGSFDRRRAVAEKQMRESNTEPVLMWSGGQHSTALGILMVKSGMKFTCAVQRRWYDKNAKITAKLPHQEKEYQWYKKWFERMVYQLLNLKISEMLWIYTIPWEIHRVFKKLHNMNH